MQLITFFLFTWWAYSVESASKKPSISGDNSKMKDQKVYSGNNATLLCVELKNVNFTLTWVKSKAKLEKKKIGKHCEQIQFNGDTERIIKGDSPLKIFKNVSKPVLGKKSQRGEEMILTSVTSKDTAYYTCVVNNSYGCAIKIMKLDVIEKTGIHKVLRWNFSYTNWNASKLCPKMKVGYSTNFPLEKDDKIILYADEFNRDVKFNCTFHNYSGYCIGDIVTGFVNEKNYTLKLFLLQSKGSRINIGNIVKAIKYEEVRGKLHLKANSVKEKSVEINWYRPWLTGCGSTLKWGKFESKLCSITQSTSCNETEIYAGVESGVLCGPKNKREKDKIYICKQTVNGLKPNMDYSYRLRYSLKLIGTSWSMWSNYVNFTTLSEVPNAPHVQCKVMDKYIVITWKVPPSYHTRIKIKSFRIQTIAKEYEVEADRRIYKQYYKSTEKQSVLVSACSNSGCATSVRTSCGPDTSSLKKFIIIGTLAGVIFIVILFVVGYLICNKIRRKRRSRLESTGSNNQESILIQPRTMSESSTA